VVLEATRWGVPSITTAYNGAAEVMADGAGIVVPSPRDLPAIVAAMDELADPARRAACADVCRRKADDLSMDRHVDQLLAAYAEAPAPA
jgi:glycosyltransferase involved in cell wall biosynthesis